MFVTSGVLFVAALTCSELSWRASRYYYVLSAYAGAILLSALAAADQLTSAGKLLVEAYVLMIAVLTFNIVRSDRELKLLIHAWMAGAALTALAGILGIILFYCRVKSEINIFISHYGTLFPGNYPRIRSLFLNMNMCCNYLSISFLLLLAMRSLGWIGKRAALVLGAAMIVAAVFTLSPGLGGFALGAGLWFWAEYRERGRTAAGRIALLAGILVSVGFVSTTLISPPSLFGPNGGLRFSHLQPSGRVLCWRDALNTLWHYTYLGKGPGSSVATAHYVTASGEQQVLTDAHNVYLSIAAQKGVLGLAAFCVLLVFVLRRPNLKTIGSPEVVLHTAAWIALVQALLYQGLAGSWEHTRHIWLLVGLTWALQAPDAWNREPIRLKRLV
jgi:hypothetical protein